MGSTSVADIDLGFNTWRRGERLRLARVDAPETDENPTAAATATDALKDKLGDGRDLYICTVKAARSDREMVGSFGRYLVEIYVPGRVEAGEPEHLNVNDWLVSEGYAVPYEGR